VSIDRPPPKPGERVGNYLLGREVGSGGIATVFLAEGPQGEVAVKVLRSDQLTSEQARRLQREFVILQRFDHPHIVKVHEHGEHGGYPWLAMEFVDGKDLASLFTAWQTASPTDRWARVETLLRQLASALSTLHASGAIHRDIKPSNILLTSKGEPKLSDFGGVKDAGAFTTNLTVAGQLVGTVAFMAPEQISGDAIDARTDLYALGAVLYVALTGKRPIVADTIAGFLARHLVEDPPPPSAVNPHVPPHLDRICQKMLRKDPKQRFASADDVLAALDAPRGEELPPIRGRDLILRLLDEAIADLGMGHGRALHLHGPVGSGRSSMIAEMEIRGRNAGLQVLRMREDTPLQKLAAPPAVVLIDDVEAFDRTELSAALHGFPLDSLLVTTGLSDRAPLHDADVLELGPLPHDATATLLRDRSLSGVLAATLARRLHGDRAPLPGAAVAQLHALVDAGWLVHRGSRLRLGVPMERLRDDPLPLPASERAQLLQLMGSLGPDERETLEHLLVLGEEVSVDLLRGLCPAAPHALPALEKQHGLVDRRTEGPHEAVVLRSAPTARVLYEALAPERRLVLHGAIAAHLLERHSRRPASVAARAARHLVRAGQPLEATPLFELALKRAARRGRWDEVASLAEQALAHRDQLDDDSVLARLLAARGRALVELGRPVAARGALLEALEVTNSTPGRLRAWLGVALGLLGEHENAARTLEEALSLLPEQDDSRYRAWVALAKARGHLGQHDAARQAWRAALSEFGDSTPGRRGAVELGLGQLELAAGQIGGARAPLERAERDLRATRQAGALAACLIDLADLDLVGGSYPAALARSEEAVALARDVGDVALAAGALAVRSRSLGVLGQHEQSDALAEEAVGLARAQGGPAPGGLLLLGRVAEHLERGRVHPHHGLLMLVVDARSLARAGQVQSALERALHAWSHVPSTGCRGLALEVALVLHELDGRREHRDAAVDLGGQLARGLPPELRQSFRARLPA